MTGKTLLFKVGDDVVSFESESPPSIFDDPSIKEERTFLIPQGPVKLSLTTPNPIGTLGLPDPEEGVFLLVEEDVALRLPWRTDLLVVSLLEMLRLPSAEDGSEVEHISVVVALDQGLGPVPEDIRAITFD